MHQRLHHIYTWLERRGSLVVIMCIILYITVFSAFSAVKLEHFGYNALDLGIYTNVAWHTTHGDLFGMTIHPQSYLGDHLELAFLPVAGAYALFSSPLTLLILQTIALALVAWPIFLLAKKRLGTALGILLACLYLINPFVQNTNAFEFHMLPFAVLPIAWALLAYEEKKFGRLIVLMLIAFTVREDVALIFMGIGIFAWIDGRSWRWRLTPLITGLVWFVTALLIVSHVNPEGVYKFFAYYPVGNSSVPIATRLWEVGLAGIGRLVSLETAILLTALLLPFAALPVISPKRLIPGILVALQLLMTGFTELVLKTHYAILLVPVLIYATIYALGRIRAQPPQIFRKVQKPFAISILLVTVASLYSFLTFGPLPSFIALTVTDKNQDGQNVSTLQQAVELIRPDDAVVSSFSSLPAVAGRENVYSLHYAYLGTRQYSDTAYEVPEDADTLLIDFRDFLIYELQSENIRPYVDAKETGPQRIRDLITDRDFRLTIIADSVAVYRKSQESNLTLVTFPTALPEKIKGSTRDLGPITYLGWVPIDGQEGTKTAVSLFWKANGTLTQRYQLDTRWENQNGEQREKLYPLAYGLYPTTEWIPGQIIQTSYWFTPQLESPEHLDVILSDISGYMTLDGMRSASMKFIYARPLAREWVRLW